MIKVIIDQQCHPGKEAQFNDLLMELRDMAMRQRGYITGETLQDLINPSRFTVISTWSSFKDWKRWQESHKRIVMDEMIESMTSNERKLSFFTVNHGRE